MNADREGGSYVVQPDGSLKRVEWTEPSSAGPKEAPQPATPREGATPSKPAKAVKKEA